MVKTLNVLMDRVAANVDERGWDMEQSRALIDLKDLHTSPGDVFLGQSAQHDPWGMASADCHDESPPSGDRGPGILGNDRGSS